MSKQDPYKTLLTTFENPTKLSIIFLLSHYGKMTVTQMSKHVGVGKANLYHFVGQMVRDGLLAKPESQVTKNYVEKYYKLNPQPFEAADPTEQRKRFKTAKPEELRNILQSGLASIALYLRMIAEEIARADEKMLQQVTSAIRDDRVNLSYSILPEDAYRYVLGEMRRIANVTNEKWGREKSPMSGSRVIVVGLPQFRGEK